MRPAMWEDAFDCDGMDLDTCDLYEYRGGRIRHHTLRGTHHGSQSRTARRNRRHHPSRA